MKSTKLLKLYSKANLELESAFKLSIPPRSTVEDVKTVKGVCGFVIPLSGEAIYKVDGNSYRLGAGKILHAGSGMPLSKTVVSTKSWDYILLHYKVLGDYETKRCLEAQTFMVDLQCTQMDQAQAMAHELLKLHKKMEVKDMIQSKIRLYQYVDFLMQASYEQSLESDNEKIPYIAEYMEAHLHENLTVSELAQMLGMSDKAFAYSFKKTMGVSSKRYMMNQRIKKAEALLLGTDKAVSEISEMVGCEDALYFSRMFRKNTGFSPSEFRKFFGKSPYGF